MHFYVIYSFECSRRQSVKLFQPPEANNRRIWSLTEGDECFTELYENREGKHRKYVGILKKEEFIEFVNHCSLLMENIETMGSLRIGIIPAFLFIRDPFCDNPDEAPIRADAFVTPLPEVTKNTNISDEKHQHLDRKRWEWFRKVMLNMFG